MSIMSSASGASLWRGYEYYNDKVSGREPIVTNYNFN